MAKLVLAAAFLVCNADVVSAQPQANAAVRNLGGQRELFVDDYLIAKLKGAELVMHAPVAHDVALVCDAPWEGNTSAYFTVFADGDRYQMYYRASHAAEGTKKETHSEFTCYAESKDGVRFEKPKLGLFEFNGSKENNIVWTGAGTHNFTPFLDGNTRAPTKSRYKALAGGRGGLIAYESLDGIRWAAMSDKAVITDGAFDSQNLAFWDEVHGEYRAYWRYFDKVTGHRSIRTATSKDFLQWEKQADLRYGATPSEHLYTNAIRPYFRAPHLFVGFPTRFQPKHEQVEPILMTSRDGVNFKRWPEPLIPITAPKDRDGNRSNYMVNGLVQLPGKPNEMSVYATEAYYTGPGSRVRRFTFRTDGFVSVHAGATAGELLTKPFRFQGECLALNYRTGTGGAARVEILNAAGQPFAGFTHADCQPLTGDAIDGVVRWTAGASVGKLAGETIRLRFVMQQADLFALQFIKADSADAAALSRAAKRVREIIGHRGSMLDRPENTLASYRRAIEAGATVTECDIRTTKDGALVSLHDADVKRTSNGKGKVADLTLAELRQLDFGSWFDPKFKDERIPTLVEILDLCRGKIDVMIDLVESGPAYAEAIASLVRKHGEPKRLVLGIRSIDHAHRFRKLLPEARQIGLIPTPSDIAAFAEAGVETIRLWPKWLPDRSLVAQVRQHKKQLHLGTGKGTMSDVLPLLAHEPESMASDDPERLVRTLAEIAGRR